MKRLKDKTLTIRDNIKLHLGSVDNEYLQNRTLGMNKLEIVPNCIEFIPFEKYSNIIPLSSSSTGVSSKNNQLMRGILFFISDKTKLMQLIIYKELKPKLIEYGDLLFNSSKTNETNKYTNIKQTLKYFKVIINTSSSKAFVIYGTEYTLYKTEIDFLEFNDNNANNSMKSNIIFDVSNIPNFIIANVYFPNQNEDEVVNYIYIQVGNNSLFVIDYNKTFDTMITTHLMKDVFIEKKQKKISLNVYIVNYSSKLNKQFALQNKYISFHHISNSNIIYYLQIDLIKINNNKNNKQITYKYVNTHFNSVSISSTKMIAINLLSGQVLLFEENDTYPPWLWSYYLISPSQCSCLIFSSDNNLLAIGSQDNNVYIIDILTKKPLACLVGHCNYIKYIYFEDNSNEIRNTMSFNRLSNVTKNNQIKQININDFFKMWTDNDYSIKPKLTNTQFNKEVTTIPNNKSQWEKYSLCTIGLDGYIGSYEIHRSNNEDDDDESNCNDNNNNNSVYLKNKFRFSNNNNGSRSGNGGNEYICNVEGPQSVVLTEQRMRMLNIEVINPIYMNKNILNLPIVKFWKSSDYLFIVGIRNKNGSDIMFSFFDLQKVNESQNKNPFEKKEKKEDIINIELLNKKYSLINLNLDNIGINIETITAELKQSQGIVIKQIKDNIYK